MGLSIIIIILQGYRSYAGEEGMTRTQAFFNVEKMIWRGLNLQSDYWSYLSITNEAGKCLRGRNVLIGVHWNKSEKPILYHSTQLWKIQFNAYLYLHTNIKRAKHVNDGQFEWRMHNIDGKTNQRQHLSRTIEEANSKLKSNLIKPKRQFTLKETWTAMESVWLYLKLDTSYKITRMILVRNWRMAALVESISRNNFAMAITLLLLLLGFCCDLLILLVLIMSVNWMRNVVMSYHCIYTILWF